MSALSEIFSSAGAKPPSTAPQNNATDTGPLGGIFNTSPTAPPSAPAPAVTAPTTTPAPTAPSKSGNSFLDTVESFLGIGPKTAPPAATPAPAAAAPKTSALTGIFSPPKSSDSSGKATPLSKVFPAAPSQTPQKGAVPSPYFSAATPSGATIGFSDQLDNSGKPFFAYRNPGDTATTTDKTRIATTFDPRTPQKLDQSTFLTPRAVESRAALKQAMGGTYNDQLDHTISLELSGSNDQSNLRIEPDVPGSTNTATDPLETSLAKQVVAGKISLFDAQTQLAKAKGVNIPWTDDQHKGSPFIDFLNDVWNQTKSAFGGLIHSTVPQAQAQTSDTAQPNQVQTFHPNVLDHPTYSLGTPSPAANTDKSTPITFTPSDPTNFFENLFDPNGKTVIQPLGFTKEEATTYTGPTAIFGVAKAINDLVSWSVKAIPSFALKTYGSITNQDVKVNPEIASRFLTEGTADDTGTVKPVGQQALDRQAQLDQERPTTPWLNTIQSFGETVLPTIFEGFASLGGAQETIDKILSDSQFAKTLGLNSSALRDLAPEDFGKIVVTRTQDKINEVASGLADGSLSKDQAMQQLKNIAADYKAIGNGYLNGTIPQSTQFGKLMQNFAAMLNENVGNLGNINYVPIEGKIRPADETLPGYRPVAPAGMNAGLSVQPIEPVGFGSENASTPEENRTPSDQLRTPAPVHPDGGETTVSTAQNAVNSLIKNSGGDVPGALSNPQIGSVDATWGKPSIDGKKGYGIAKIQSDHPEILPHLAQALQDAKVVEKLPDRTILQTSGPKPIRIIVDHQLGTDKGIVRKTFLNNAYYVLRGGIEPPTARFSVESSTSELPKRGGTIADTSTGVNGDTVDNSKSYKPLTNPSPGAPTFEGHDDLTTKILEKLKKRSLVSKQFISDLTNSPELKQGEKDIVRSILHQYPDGKDVPVKEFADRVKAELLPLQSNTMEHGRYENVSLPEDLRGNVANYHERVYNSPIKTSAGDIHFGGRTEGKPYESSNYFGHTRVEDMAGTPGTKMFSGPEQGTRRIIEVQSDLYQKGRLESEFGGEHPGETMKSLVDNYPNSASGKRAAEIQKLAQYSNPTAHFRMVREEIKQAAIDGKTKLQFPTGETAMKIEGLGERTAWVQIGGKNDDVTLRPGDLEVGKTVAQRNGDSQWIITDVLGDGKFKAIQNRELELALEKFGGMDGTSFSEQLTYAEHHAPEALKNAETFDISGKVDTSNPIYRFYEKDLGRYLKNTYGAKTITDAQGVTWNEVDIKPSMAKQPVDAFKRAAPSSQSSVEKSALNQGVPLNTPVKRAQAIAESLFDKGEIDFLFPQDKIAEGPDAWGRYSPRKSFQNPLIQVVQHNGLISDHVLYHEAFHAYLDKFVSTPERKALIDAIKRNMATAPARGLYRIDGYKGADVRAEEYAADAFADYMKGKDVPPEAKSFFQRILDRIKGWIRKVTGMQDIFDRAESKDRSFVRSNSRRLTVEDVSFNKLMNKTVEDDAAYEHVGDIINQGNSDKLDSIEERAEHLSVEKESLDQNPAKYLVQYVNKRTGELPTVTGGPEAKGEFAKRGDDIVTEYGFKDPESANTAVKKYIENRKAFNEKVSKFIADKKDILEKLKEDADNFGPGHKPGDYDFEIAENNKGVMPPEVRGGIQSPELDFSKWKDVASIRLSRDTMERNLEKVAGNEADKVKDFLIEPIRQNELDRVNDMNELRTQAKEKMKSLGITRGSNEDDLVMRYGEGLVSLTELKKATPKWKEVEQAADYTRKVYDNFLDQWNQERDKFGYRPVAKRPDYFRHFSDINQWTNSFGFLRSDSQLPTAIAGISSTFRPGKPFSTAELHREGTMTSFSAIGGLDNYIDSVSKQIYHIDSIQRGRALEKYLREVAKANPYLKLPNFAGNLTEFTNLVSGKAASIDRSIESTLGRPVMKFINGASNLLARNIVVGNISVALTHLVSIPLNLATTDKAPFIHGMLKTLVSPLQSEPINVIDGVKSSFLTRRFPIKSIMPTKFDRLQDTLSFIFKVTDEFKSKLAVASKYYEGLNDGLSKGDAMAAADKYAGRIVGDYSIGNRPNLMSAHTTKLLAQFQLGVNDGLSVLMHDIPHWEKGNKWKIAARLVQFAIFSYLFNQVYTRMRGSGKGLDPIDAGLTAAGLNDEGQGQDFLHRLALAGNDLAGELPFTSIFTGGLPLSTAIGQPLQQLAQGNYKGMLGSLATDFASPIGGGEQVKKTVAGIQAYNAGQTTTAKGEKNQTVAKTPTNLIKGAVFGPTAFQGAKTTTNETTNLIGMLNSPNASITKQAEDLYAKYKAMDPAAATDAFNKMATLNPALAKRVAEVAKDDQLGITLNERLIKQLGVANGQRAQYIYQKIMALPDAASRTALWNDYANKKIISAQVASQIEALLAKPQ